MIILYGIAIFFTLAEILSKVLKNKKMIKMLNGLTVIFKWNLFLMVFCGNLDEITLYGTLELRKVVVTNFLEFLSLFLVLFCGALLVLIFGMSFYVAYKF